MSTAAMGISLRDGVKHQLKAGIVPQNNVVSRNAQQFAEDLPHFRQAVPHAIVAAVVAIGVGKFAAGMKGLQYPQSQVQLLNAGLASSHVQIQPPCPEGLIFFPSLLLQLFEFSKVHCNQLFCVNRDAFHSLHLLMNNSHTLVFILFS